METVKIKWKIKAVTDINTQVDSLQKLQHIQALRKLMWIE